MKNWSFRFALFCCSFVCVLRNCFSSGLYEVTSSSICSSESFVNVSTVTLRGKHVCESHIDRSYACKNVLNNLSGNCSSDCHVHRENVLSVLILLSEWNEVCRCFWIEIEVIRSDWIRSFWKSVVLFENCDHVVIDMFLTSTKYHISSVGVQNFHDFFCYQMFENESNIYMNKRLLIFMPHSVAFHKLIRFYLRIRVLYLSL